MSYDQRPTKIRVVKDQAKPEPADSASAASAVPAKASAAGATAKAPGVAVRGQSRGANKAAAKGGAVVPASAGVPAAAVAETAPSTKFWLIGVALFLLASAAG